MILQDLFYFHFCSYIFMIWLKLFSLTCVYLLKNRVWHSNIGWYQYRVNTFRFQTKKAKSKKIKYYYNEIKITEYLNANNLWCILEGIYTWNFSRVEIIHVCFEISLTVYTFSPGWNFISWWNHLCQKGRDEISSQEEKKKKRCVNTSSRDEIL